MTAQKGSAVVLRYVLVAEPGCHAEATACLCLMCTNCGW